GPPAGGAEAVPWPAPLPRHHPLPAPRHRPALGRNDPVREADLALVAPDGDRSMSIIARLLGFVMPYKFLVIGVVGAGMALGMLYLHLQNRALAAEKANLAGQLTTAIRVATENAMKNELLMQ